MLNIPNISWSSESKRRSNTKIQFLVFKGCIKSKTDFRAFYSDFISSVRTRYSKNILNISNILWKSETKEGSHAKIQFLVFKGCLKSNPDFTTFNSDFIY
jgi:hypothetical protein